MFRPVPDRIVDVAILHRTGLVEQCGFLGLGRAQHVFRGSHGGPKYPGRAGPLRW